MNSKYNFFTKALDKKKQQKKYQQLRCVVPIDENSVLGNDKKTVNFTSMDFLGLSYHPYVKKKIIQFVLKYGAGTSATRPVTSHIESQIAIEQKLARLIGFETALLLNSSYQAHHLLFSTLTNERSIIFADRYLHPTLLRQAKVKDAKIMRYEHCNLQQLESLLEKNRSASSKIIFSESIFSLEGNQCPLKELAALAESHDALLYIDDSHAVGVFGKHGMGLTSHRKGIDFTVGSFGKTVGSFGSFIGCNKMIKEYLMHFCPQYFQMTTMPPAVLGAIDSALDLIPDMDAERKKILENSAYLQNKLKRSKWQVGAAPTHIIPLYLESESKLADHLANEKILCTFAKTPFPPKETSRLVLMVNALLNASHFTHFIETLDDWKMSHFPRMTNARIDRHAM